MLNVFYSAEMQSLVKQVQLNPWWISGLFTGEGCFSIQFSNNRFSLSILLVLTSTNQH